MKHGHTTHTTLSPTYVSWAKMKSRCTNKNDINFFRYKDLGFDPKWKTFEGFIADMGERPDGTSLDRIDGSKGYFKENCRWASKKVQNINRKGSTKSTSEYKGVYWDSARNKWGARIENNKKKIFIGRFDSELEAAQAYDEKALELFGEVAYLNFRNK